MNTSLSGSGNALSRAALSIHVVPEKKQGLICRLKCMFGHKHNAKPNGFQNDLQNTIADRRLHDLQSGSNRVSTSAPVTPDNRGSRISIRTKPLLQSSSLNNVNSGVSATHSQAGEAYRRHSADSPAIYTQASTYKFAVDSLNYAKLVQNDQDKGKYFDNAISYATYSASLGNLDAVKFLNAAYKDGVTSIDGKTNLREDPQSRMFWQRTEAQLFTKLDNTLLPKKFDPSALTQFQLGKTRKSPDQVAAEFVQSQNYIRGDSGTSIADTQDLTTKLNQIKEGDVKELPAVIINYVLDVYRARS